MKMKRTVSVLLILVFSLFITASAAKTSTVKAAAPKKGGILKLATMLNPKIIGYPAEVTNNGPLPFLDPVIQALGRFNEKGDLAPWLAKDWTQSSKDKTITFNLRNGVKFSDGTDFNADAVKWNIGKYIEAKRSEVANIDSIDVVDKDTVKIHVKAWDSSTLTAIGFFVRYISPTAFNAHGKEWCYTNPVGTGPFLLDKWEMNVSVSYKKNPNYWESGKPYLDGIKMLIMGDEQTEVSSLQAGEVDGYQAANIDIANQLIKSKKYDVVLHKNGVGDVGVGLIPDSVTKGSPFADVRVRKAMCYAIDEKLLAKTFGKGYYTTTNQWGAPGTITYNPTVVGYPYNPQKAKELLKLAGYPNGFKTKLFTGAGTKDLMTAIQAELAAVGIDGEVVLCDEAKVQSLYFSTWEGGLMFHFHTVQPDLGLYMSRHLLPGGAFYAKGIQHPKEVVNLIYQCQHAVTPISKKLTSYSLQKMVYDKYALVGKPLYIPIGIFIKQKYVKDDGNLVTHTSTWTPESAYLAK